MQQRFAPLFCAAAAAFGVSAIGCFVLAQRVPFNPLEILWDPRQPAYLLAVYLLLALPFLCAGACVCMAFSRWRGMASRIYSFDILGAGAGSLAVVALLFVLPPQDALRLIGALGFAAAALAWLECGRPRRWPAAALMAMAGLPFLLPPVVGRARDVAVQGAVADPAHSPGTGRGGALRARWAWSALSRARAFPCAMRRG